MQNNQKLSKKILKLHRKIRKTGRATGNEPVQRLSNKYKPAVIYKFKKDQLSTLSTQQSTISSNDSILLKRPINISGTNLADLTKSTSYSCYNNFNTSPRPFHTFSAPVLNRPNNEQTDDEFDFFIEDCINRYRDKGFNVPDPLYAINRLISGSHSDTLDVSSDEIGMDGANEIGTGRHFMF